MAVTAVTCFHNQHFIIYCPCGRHRHACANGMACYHHLSVYAHRYPTSDHQLGEPGSGPHSRFHISRSFCGSGCSMNMGMGMGVDVYMYWNAWPRSYSDWIAGWALGRWVDHSVGRARAPRPTASSHNKGLLPGSNNTRINHCRIFIASAFLSLGTR